MKSLKFISLFFLIVFFLISCGSISRKNITSNKKPIEITKDSTEYEVLIFDVGFNQYINSIAKPKGYYSLSYLENRNSLYVTEWNLRFRNPSQYKSSIYEYSIDYDANIKYGYDVNFILFNYFKFVERKNNIKILNNFR